ncbi:MAG: hypothetical protein LBK06_05195 [Planctomycetaceae bacterium]|nr:hypothetical protein [Planctomycetaceae bacterium]
MLFVSRKGGQWSDNWGDSLIPTNVFSTFSFSEYMLKRLFKGEAYRPTGFGIMESLGVHGSFVCSCCQK